MRGDSLMVERESQFLTQALSSFDIYRLESCLELLRQYRDYFKRLTQDLSKQHSGRFSFIKQFMFLWVNGRPGFSKNPHAGSIPARSFIRKFRLIGYMRYVVKSICSSMVEQIGPYKTTVVW